MSDQSDKSENLKPFKPIGSQPLSRRPICVKVEVEIDEAVHSIPDKTDWLRKLIAFGVRERGIYQND